MNNEQVYKRLGTIFEDIFGIESITLKPDTTAADIEDWDSLHHIQIINAVEQEFKMKFTMKQVSSMENIGDMVEIIIDSQKSGK